MQLSLGVVVNIRSRSYEKNESCRKFNFTTDKYTIKLHLCNLVYKSNWSEVVYFNCVVESKQRTLSCAEMSIYNPNLNVLPAAKAGRQIK